MVSIRAVSLDWDAIYFSKSVCATYYTIFLLKIEVYFIVFYGMTMPIWIKKAWALIKII